MGEENMQQPVFHHIILIGDPHFMPQTFYHDTPECAVLWIAFVMMRIKPISMQKTSQTTFQ